MWSCSARRPPASVEDDRLDDGNVNMSTVVMPQMGESIAEGTIVRWIKKVGDNVDRDEPLFEISTDKVDAEIPSPAAGTLLEIKVKEGETVAVNSVVATIGGAGESGGRGAPAPPPSGKTAPAKPPADGSPASAPASTPRHPPPRRATLTPAPPSPHPHRPRELESRRATARPRRSRRALSAAKARQAARGPGPRRRATLPSDAESRQRSSPLVRRSPRSTVSTSARSPARGLAGVSRRTTSSATSRRRTCAGAHRTRSTPGSARPPSHRAGIRARASAWQAAPSPPHPAAAAADRIEPMSIMRKKIAEHMVLSTHTSAHVYSVFEVNYHRVDQIRKRARRAEYEQTRRQAHLHVVHRQGRDRLPAAPPGDQRVDRRR